MKPKVIDRVNVLDELIKTTKIVQNLNEIVNDGDCQSFTVTSENKPSFMFDGICTFHKYFGANSGHQFAQGWNQGGGLGECVCGIRYLTNGTWSEWQEIATTQQINDLSSNSLQAKSTSAFGKDFNNVNIIGMYHVIDVQSWSNKPPTVENVGNIIVMGGTNNNSLSKVQYFIPYNNTGIYIRTRGYGLSEWMGWQQIATTTKTPFSCTASTGYEIVWQDCYTLNGVKYIHVRMKKINNSVFEVIQHFVFSVPFSSAKTITPLTIMPYLNASLTTMGTTQASGVLWNDSHAYIAPTTASAYGFEIKCVYE